MSSEYKQVPNGQLVSRSNAKSQRIHDSSIPCRFYWEGSCPYGSKCRNPHPSLVQKIKNLEVRLSVCRYYVSSVGCKYGDKCRFAHESLGSYYEKWFRTIEQRAVEQDLINEKLAQERKLAEQKRLKEEKKAEEKRLAQQKEEERRRLEKLKEDEKREYRRDLVIYQGIKDNAHGKSWSTGCSHLLRILTGVFPESLIKLIADYGCPDRYVPMGFHHFTPYLQEWRWSCGLKL